MARYFVDTSALIKLYRTEPDSAAVRRLVSATDQLVIACTTLLEFRSAFALLCRTRQVSPSIANTYILAFEASTPQYEIVAIDGAVIRGATRLLDTHAVADGLRPLDALQVACALEAHALTPLDALLTTDAVLATVAAASGLTVKP